MIMSEANLQTIQEIYGAFGRSDVTGIVERCTEETEWCFNGARSEVPWHATRRGRSSVPDFIAAFVTNVDLHDFRPKTFIHSGDDVVCNIAIEYTVKKTGRRVKEDQLHWWSLQNGKVARLVHFEDTAQVAAAHQV